MGTTNQRGMAHRTVGVGLTAGTGQTADIDFTELPAAAVAVDADSIPIITAAGASSQEAVADLVTAVTGTGLVAAAGVIALDIDGCGDATLDPAIDTICFIDESAVGDPTKLESVADLMTAVVDGKTISAAAGVISVKAACLKHVLADGTAAATEVTIAGMAVGDELISVHAQTTKANIASIADRTSEYAVGAGKLTKAAGTNETSNQLDIWYWDRT